MDEPILLPELSTADDFDAESLRPIYAATVTVSGGEAGHGRVSGRARSADGVLDLVLRMPAELGGDDAGTNPEQLFAAGFAACFHSALSLVARQAGLDPAPILVAATVAFGRDPDGGGYLLRVDLTIKWPGADRGAATSLLNKALALCPYATMTRRGAPLTIRLAC